jgi:hypothetical protein
VRAVSTSVDQGSATLPILTGLAVRNDGTVIPNF